MKYMSRAGIYKASNVTFNPETMQAVSYGWWRFVDCINGKLVFNRYNYSATTLKHQSKTRALLREIGAVVDIELAVPAGLQASNALESAVRHYEQLIQELEEAIARPRSKAETNLRRKAQIGEYAQAIITARRVLGGAK